MALDGVRFTHLGVPAASARKFTLAFLAIEVLLRVQGVRGLRCQRGVGEADGLQDAFVGVFDVR